jgi:transcriptional regulator with XRE-family HTH domain
MEAKKFVPIGDRIALLRHRRGLSQVKLAGLVGRSESWLSQVERGERPIERLGIISELARVLDVPVSEMTGNPPATVRDPAEQHRAVEQIRRALSDFDFLTLLMRTDRDPSAPEPDLSALGRRVDEAWQLTHGSDYTHLAQLLVSLLADGERAAHAVETDKHAEVFALMARMYHTVAALMSKLGETELSWVAGERSIMAAERAGARLLAMAGAYRLAQGFVSGWRLEQADHVASSGALAVASQITDGTAEGVSLYGAFNLVRAVVASRRGDGATAWQAVAEAERAAERNGEDRNDYETEFGPTNVALHAVAVAVELGEAGEALRRSADVHPDSLSVERRGRFLIDVARAQGQRRDTPAAVSTLRQAFELTPEQVQYHPLVRELVRDLVRRGRRKPNSDLMRLAESIGVV